MQPVREPSEAPHKGAAQHKAEDDDQEQVFELHERDAPSYRILRTVNCVAFFHRKVVKGRTFRFAPSVTRAAFLSSTSR